MKNFVKNFWRRDRDLMIAKSRRDCHARGVDSVLLDDTPGSRIWLFAAHGGRHELWRNTWGWSFNNGPITVPYHAHRFDLDIQVELGCIAIAVGRELNPIGQKLQKFRYPAASLANECKFEPLGECRFNVEQSRFYHTGDRLHLNANEIRTVYVRQGKSAAWFRFEGADDPNYEPIIYSNADLTTFDATGIYDTMDEAYLRALLEGVFGDLD